MSKFYKEGLNSFYKNNGRYSNPYQTGTFEFDEFERGWIQAQRRSPDLSKA